MAEYKIRVKVGPHEFDAEGSKEFVEELFARFETLVSSKPAPQAIIPPREDPTAISPEDPRSGEYGKVFNVENGRISLIGRFSGHDRDLDAALLVLFGHREIKGSDAVSADDLLYGLRHTGYTIDRADRLMERGKNSGLLNYSGIRRGTKYRLTVPGITKAKELARELLDMFQIH